MINAVPLASVVRISIALSAAWLCANPAHAQLNRTAVSLTGIDADNCSPATPCRTFARAMSQTNSGGEIIVRDSAGYGPFTINKSVTVQAAPGVYAGITATSGNAITISLGPSGKVVLRGLTLEGLGTGARGIDGFGGVVHIENCVVNGFDFGIVVGGYTATINDSVVRNNRTIGIIVANAGNRAILEHVQVKNNVTWGVVVQDSARGTIRNSVVTGHTIGLAAIASGVLNIENTASSHNTTGVAADSGGTIRASNTFVTDNSSSGLRKDVGTFDSWGNNKVRGNLLDTSGAITTVGQQ